MILLILQAQAAFPRTDGSQILSRDGSAIKLRGIGLGNYMNLEGYMLRLQNSNSQSLIFQLVQQLLGPSYLNKFTATYLDNYFDEFDVKLLSTAGINLIRLPINWKYFYSNKLQPLQQGFQIINRILGYVKKYNMSLIIDLHSAPGGQTGTNIDDSQGYPFVYQDAALRKLTINLWQRIAQTYKREQYILGYQLFNQPIAAQHKQMKALLLPLYKQIITAIRKIDPNHIIILDGAIYSTDFTIFQPPFQSNLIFSFHLYWAQPVYQNIRRFIEFRDKYKVPIWMGQSGQNTNQWIKQFVILLQKNNISWAFWPYKKMNATSCFVSFNVNDWEIIQRYDKSDRGSVDSMMKNRPKNDEARRVLQQLLQNVKSRNCRINQDFITALFPKQIEQQRL